MENKYDEMLETVTKLCAPYKGILAADESTGTIGKRFAQIGVENNLCNRREYRNIIFNAPTLNEYISGVITFEETLFDNNGSNDIRLIQPLLNNDIIVGIKTDLGLTNIPLLNEKMTKGLDDLNERTKKYYEAGARFAKWRCVIDCNFSDGLPSQEAIEINASILAHYAAISQENGLVPIVEPEVLINDSSTIEESEFVTKRVLTEVFYQLNKKGVMLNLMLLKPNMVRCGINCVSPVDNLEIAERTLGVLRDTVPPSVPGIVFLSGGMSEEQATECLFLMNKSKIHDPWRLSFSYGRALQQSALQSWSGKSDNMTDAQNSLIFRAKENSLASEGKQQKQQNN